MPATPSSHASLIACLLLFNTRPRPISLLISVLNTLCRCLAILCPVILLTVVVTCILRPLVILFPGTILLTLMMTCFLRPLVILVPIILLTLKLTSLPRPLVTPIPIRGVLLTRVGTLLLLLLLLLLRCVVMHVPVSLLMTLLIPAASCYSVPGVFVVLLSH